MKKIRHLKFTMTELIVAVCIAAILVPLLILFLREFREKSRRISCSSELKGIGFALRMYSQENKNEFPHKPGRAGFEMIRSAGYLESTEMYTCPSTKDRISDGSDLTVSPVSYLYANGLNESTSVDSGIARDRDTNHSKYGNVLFVDGHAQGFTGADWTASMNNLGSSNFSY